MSLVLLALLTGLVVNFGGHYLFYYSTVRFFAITALQTKLVVGAVFFLLSISFLVGSLSAHYSENIVTEKMYYFSGLWLGIGLNLLLATILAWLVYGILKVFGMTIDLRLMGVAVLIVALSYSGYGIWNAYHPRVKNISVKIKNLPVEWQGKKVVQISDVHLGLVLGSRFLEKVTEKVNAENPEVVFITGDLFDGMDGDLDGLVKPLENLRSSRGAYYVTGNHETYLGVAGALAAVRTTPVQVLDNKLINLSGLQVIGLSYPERGQQLDVAKVIQSLPGFDAQQASILLYHNPNQFKAAKASGINLQLSGHTHVGQLWPLNFITDRVYESKDYGLFQDGDYSLYTTSGTGVWGPTMRTGNTPEIVVITLE